MTCVAYVFFSMFSAVFSQNYSFHFYHLEIKGSFSSKHTVGHHCAKHRPTQNFLHPRNCGNLIPENSVLGSRVQASLDYFPRIHCPRLNLSQPSRLPMKSCQPTIFLNWVARIFNARKKINQKTKFPSNYPNL